jgi:NAD(P)-dependent dehydrogenase (short-subunit alcohol dehydrogenase family)
MPKIQLKDSVALITGANRGIGRAYVEALVRAGARKVYAAARRLESVDSLVAAHPGVVEGLALDISNPAQITAAAAKATDVTVLINNAGVANGSYLFGAAGASGMRKDVEVNLFGTTDMIRAFAPVLEANGGSALVVLNSVVSLVNFPIFGGYSASKAALHSVTQAARAELTPKGILVTGVYPGPIDTDMADAIDQPKEPPSAVAEATLTALANGEEEVFPDAMSKNLARDYKADWKALERNIAGAPAAA